MSCAVTEREKERDRQTDRDRETDRQRQTQTHTQTDRDRETDRQREGGGRERDRDRNRHTERGLEYNLYTQTGGDKHRQSGRLATTKYLRNYFCVEINYLPQLLQVRKPETEDSAQRFLPSSSLSFIISVVLTGQTTSISHRLHGSPLLDNQNGIMSSKITSRETPTTNAKNFRQQSQSGIN